MQNKFRKFEEIVFYDLWIPDSGFRFRIPVSGFRVLGLPYCVQYAYYARFVAAVLINI